MNKLIISVILFCCPGALQAQSKTACYADSFNLLNTQVRDQTIEKIPARKLAAYYLEQIKSNYTATQVKESLKVEWYFPLSGYDQKAIGGVNGSGYLPKGYNYFDGNKHLGHPAHDIFIRDINQDGKDDKTKQPVQVLSISSGIVVALEKEWKTDSELRGGKYIWIYELNLGLLFYYAHNEDIKVNVCDIVKAGDTIATIGRSGKNAFKKRSPTHLHLMVLQTKSTQFLAPVNIFGKLKNAGTSH